MIIRRRATKLSGSIACRPGVDVRRGPSGWILRRGDAVEKAATVSDFDTSISE
jgi:hypothetical protein